MSLSSLATSSSSAPIAPGCAGTPQSWFTGHSALALQSVDTSRLLHQAPRSTRLASTTFSRAMTTHRVLTKSLFRGMPRQGHTRERIWKIDLQARSWMPLDKRNQARMVACPPTRTRACFRNSGSSQPSPWDWVRSTRFIKRSSTATSRAGTSRTQVVNTFGHSLAMANWTRLRAVERCNWRQTMA